MTRFNHWFDTLPMTLRLGIFLGGIGVTVVLMSHERDTTPWTLGSILLLLLTMIAACRRLAPYQDLAYVRTSCHVMLAFLAACVAILVGDLLGL